MDLESRVQGFGSRVEGSGCRVQDMGFGVKGVGASTCAPKARLPGPLANIEMQLATPTVALATRLGDQARGDQAWRPLGGSRLWCVGRRGRCPARRGGGLALHTPDADEEYYRGTSLIRKTHPPRITIGP